MSDQHRHGTQRRRSSGRAPGSTGSSGSLISLRSTNSPGLRFGDLASGGEHNSGGSQSFGSSARARLYAQYGRDHDSTPSRRGSEHEYLPRDSVESQRASMSTVYTQASRVVPVGGQGSTHNSQAPSQLVFHPGSIVNSQSSASTSQRQQAASASLGNSASFAVQVGTSADSGMTTFGQGTRSYEAWLRRQREEDERQAAAATPSRQNPVRRILQKSREGLERTFHRRKK